MTNAANPMMQMLYGGGMNDFYQRLALQGYAERAAATKALAEGIRQQSAARAQRSQQASQTMADIMARGGAQSADLISRGMESGTKSLFQGVLAGAQMRQRKEEQAQEMALRNRLADLTAIDTETRQKDQAAQQEYYERGGGRGDVSREDLLANKEIFQRAETLSGMFSLAARDGKLTPQQLSEMAMTTDAQLAALEQAIPPGPGQVLLRSYRAPLMPYLPKAAPVTPPQAPVSPPMLSSPEAFGSGAANYVKRLPGDISAVAGAVPAAERGINRGYNSFLNTLFGTNYAPAPTLSDAWDAYSRWYQSLWAPSAAQQEPLPPLNLPPSQIGAPALGIPMPATGPISPEYPLNPAPYSSPYDMSR